MKKKKNTEEEGTVGLEAGTTETHRENLKE